MTTQAMFYEQIGNGDVQCHLCPHNCVLQDQERGNCDVRKNVEGTLMSENYGLCSTINFDPIEKKPLYHFYPGSHILSIGSIGCNLDCNFCQNCEISQTSIDQYITGQYYEPQEIIEIAQDHPENIGIAFTYNEPVIYFEYMLAIARLSHEKGMKNVMVSNGYINHAPLMEVMEYIDGFNIDLKAFTENFYRDVTKGTLEPVKETLKTIRQEGKHLEVTNLLIPSQNDDLANFIEMIFWIRDNLGSDTILHLSRYFPAYKSNIQKTSLGLLFNFCESARQHLDYVYLGNVTGSESQNTICNKCGKVAISRYTNFIQKNGIDDQGYCTHCQNKIVII